MRSNERSKYGLMGMVNMQQSDQRANMRLEGKNERQ